MGDKLEQFISQNRSQFDSEEPSASVWKGIEKKTGKKQPLQIWWKVAAVLFLTSTIYLVLERNSGTGTPSGEEPNQELSEFKQAERYYTRLITDKKAEIDVFEKSGLKKEFLREIEKLDQMYVELKETYATRNSTGMLVDAMINNLQLRIEILDQQLKVLKKLKEQNENESTIEI